MAAYSRYDDKPGAWCEVCRCRTHHTADCWGPGTVALGPGEKAPQYTPTPSMPLKTKLSTLPELLRKLYPAVY
jgi:hypothetical protein